MKRTILALSFSALFLITGCASNGQTTLLGSGLGMLLGAGIGALADAGPRGRARTQNIFIGAAFGSLLGGGAGYLLHEPLRSRDKETVMGTPRTAPPASRSDYTASPGQPVLLPPKVDTRYIDDQVRGNTFVPGHLEYHILEPSQWSR